MRTNRSGGLTTFFPTVEAHAETVGATQATHACVRGAPGEGQGICKSLAHQTLVRSMGNNAVERSHSPECISDQLTTKSAALRTSFFFLVATPERSHPFPSRTRKLSSPGPMVLQAQACGRVGRCRGFEGSLERVGPLLFFGFASCYCARQLRDVRGFAIRVVARGGGSRTLVVTVGGTRSSSAAPVATRLTIIGSHTSRRVQASARVPRLNASSATTHPIAAIAAAAPTTICSD